MENIEITKDQEIQETIYLLYAYAYCDANKSVTKSVVKSHLPKDWEAEKIEKKANKKKF